MTVKKTVLLDQKWNLYFCFASDLWFTDRSKRRALGRGRGGGSRGLLHFPCHSVESEHMLRLLQELHSW